MKRITFFGFLFIHVISFAQVNFGSPIAPSLGGAVTATAKNWEAIEINPANLGYEDNHGFSFSVMNVGFNLQDNGITLQELKQAKNADSLGPVQRQQISEALTAPGGLNISSTFNWFAFSIHLKKFGGLAVSLSDKLYLHAQISQDAATLITDFLNLNTKDTANVIAAVNKDAPILELPIPKILAGTNAGGYHYRELNIDYGVKLLTIKVHETGEGGASFENSDYINPSYKTSDTVSQTIKIYGGIGFKPIWGLGSYNGTVAGDQILEEGTYVYSNPNYFENIKSNIFTANGRGYGVDLGLSAVYKKWKLGVSAIDLGKINWQNTSLSSPTENIPPLDTLVNVIIKNGNIDNIVKYLVNQAPGQNYSTQLPSKFRAGISYQLINKFISLNADYVAPLNTVAGNLINPYLSVGANVNVFRIIGVGFGFATEKGFGNAIPVGGFINIFSGVEIYAGTTDALGFIGNGHVLSASFGIKIFGF